MNLKVIFRVAGKTIVMLSIFALGGNGETTQAVEVRKPNIVVIVADDLGIECLSAYGGKSYTTPNLDKLATQGMRFTHAFSNPLCSPSRATLLTGRYNFLNGVPIVIFNPEKHSETFLHTDQPSFPRHLKKAGYRTAIAGKWQLSFLDLKNEVSDFGFDEYQLWQLFGADGEKTRRFHHPHFNRNGKIIADEIDGRFGPDVNVEFLMDFMAENAESGQPFLAYYTCLLPHYPWVPTPDSKDQNDPVKVGTDKGDTKFFPDMVEYLDKNVGRLMGKLDELSIADDTVLIFVADNGTSQSIESVWGDGHLLQGGKSTMTDRGTRVPLMIRWPGVIEAGTTNDDLIDFSDLFPSLCELGGAELPGETIHGRSFVPQLRGNPGAPREWIHVQNGRKRYLRNRDFILNNSGELRPVPEIWESIRKPMNPAASEKSSAALSELQSVFSELDASR
tara:strand:+ start:2203 stop:3546 length:1344 start_codon:yes stop_codon:yes gene_type:complete